MRQSNSLFLIFAVLGLLADLSASSVSVCGITVPLDATSLTCTEYDFPPELGPAVTLLTNLTSLTMIGVPIPDYLYELTTLTDLDVRPISEMPSSAVPLQKMSSSIGKLSALAKLTWGRMDYRGGAVPSEMYTLTKLQHLILKQLSMAESIHAISSLSELKHLKVIDANIQELPQGIGSLRRLQDLDLSYNKMTKLPSQIGQLSNLRNLDIAQTPIVDEGIPYEILYLRQPMTINVESTPITKVPDMPNLSVTVGPGQSVTRQSLGNFAVPFLVQNEKLNTEAFSVLNLEADKAKTALNETNEEFAESVSNLKEEFTAEITGATAKIEDSISRLETGLVKLKADSTGSPDALLVYVGVICGILGLLLGIAAFAISINTSLKMSSSTSAGGKDSGPAESMQHLSSNI